MATCFNPLPRTPKRPGETLPGGDLDPGTGPHLDQNVLAGYATVALP